ncbi:hypothetical protein CHLRE_12g530200v5 [Chlamydomonas reinhardtii]|uniref:Uncharacterized protein n=1 Tax=Chlamydomonas reinhardtii TaxID=3055 RepID=A0A2K3D4R4_CHLRE|nr:uncharacterized protein CHLRE_12g530200v5 [Chlamydomonas reinhardtii]PNW75525.1 hypothetical protein CHLRE_12g530200v5 [Chlamydomonas reinhardtii]
MKVGGDGAGRISLRMAGGEEDEIEYTAAYSMDSTTGSKPNLHRVAPVEATTCVLVVSVYPSSMTHATAVEPPKEMMKNTLINLGNQCSKGIPKKRSEKSKKKQSAALKKRRSV